MIHQHNTPVDTFVFDYGPEPMAIEHVGHDQESLQILCGRCQNSSDIDGIRELAEVLALLLEATDHQEQAHEMRYRILPGLKDA